MKKNILFYLVLILFKFTGTALGQTVSVTKHEIVLDEKLGERQVKQIVKDKSGYYYILTAYKRIVRWDGNTFTLIDTLPNYGISLKNISFEFTYNYTGTPIFYNADKSLVLTTGENGQLNVLTKNQSFGNIRYTYYGTFNNIQKPWAEIKRLNKPAIFDKFYKGYQDVDITTIYGVGDDKFYLVASSTTYYYSAGRIIDLDFWGNWRFIVGSSLIVFFNDRYEVYADGIIKSSGSLSSINFPQKLININSKLKWGTVQNGDSTLFTYDSCIYALSFKNNIPNVKKYLSIKNYKIYNNFYYDFKSKNIFLNKAKGGFTYYSTDEPILSYNLGVVNNEFLYTITTASNGKIISNSFFQKALQPYMQVVHNSENIYSVIYFKKNYYYFLNANLFVFNTNGKIVQTIPTGSAGPIYGLVSTDSAIYFQQKKLYSVTTTNGDSKIVELPFYDGSTKLEINYIENAGNNTLFALSKPSNQIYLLNTKNLTAKKITQSPILNVRSISYLPKNNLLLVSTTGNGIFAVSATTGKQFQLPVDENKKLLFCHYVLVDDDGDFWLPTNGGLFFLSAANLQLYLNGKTKLLSYRQVEKEFNLPSIEYNGGYTLSGIKRGDSAFFSSMEGIIGIKPAYVKSKLKKQGPLPLLDEILIDGAVSNIDALINISPAYKMLELKFSIPFIQYPGVKIEYRLLNFKDSSWQETPNGKLVLSYLPPGSYTLQVKTSGTNVANPQSFSIVIKQYWYKTKWAKSLFIAGAFIFMLTLLIVRVQKIRNASLKKIDSYRQQFFQIVAHDLRTPINFYQGLADVAGYLIERKDFEGLNKVSEEIDETGLKLDMLLTNLLRWNLVEQNVTKVKLEIIFIKDIIASVLPIHEKIAATKGIKIEQRIDTDLFINTDYEIMSIVVRNLIDNGVKYAAINSNLIIESNVTNTTYNFMVSNSFLPEKRESLEKVKTRLNNNDSLEKEKEIGFGMKLTKKAVLKLNGKILVIIKENNIIFHVIIPI